MVLFRTATTANVIACAVNYCEPAITDPAGWPSPETLDRPPFTGRLDLNEVRREWIPLPLTLMNRVRVLIDDFAPVEFLDVITSDNTTE